MKGKNLGLNIFLLSIVLLLVVGQASVLGLENQKNKIIYEKLDKSLEYDEVRYEALLNQTRLELNQSQAMFNFNLQQYIKDSILSNGYVVFNLGNNQSINLVPYRE